MNYFNYFTEIENEFVRQRGTHMLISPLEVFTYTGDDGAQHRVRRPFIQKTLPDY